MLSFVGNTTEIEGMVSDIQKRDEERYRLVLQVSDEQSGKNSKVLVNVFGDNFPKDYADIAGRNVKVFGTVERPTERRNPKTFDYRLFLQAKGIHVMMNVTPYDVMIMDGDVNSFVNTLSNIRHGFADRIVENMSEESSGILIGMLFGNKNFLDDDIYEMFQKNGTAHILAVSGLHIGALYVFLNGLLKSRRNIPLNLIILSFLFTYVALSAFAPSALRAGGMIALHIFSKIMCRRYDMLCAGAFIAFIMMLVNPLVIFDMGFQLSFLAIFTIAIVIPVVSRIFDSFLTMTLTIQACLAPVTAYLFNYFSIAGFFLNVPVIFIAGIIIPLGIMLIPLSYISAPLFHFFAGILDAVCSIMYTLNEITYQGGMFFNAISPPIWAIFLFYGILFLCFSETVWIFFKRKKIKSVAILAMILTIIVLVGTTPVHDDFHKAGIIFVDVGQGDSIHIRTPQGKNVLIDGGGSRNFDVGRRILMPYLLKNGVNKIDVAFISHMHLDHYDGIFSLANNFRIDTLALYEANMVIENQILQRTGLDKEQLLYLTSGQKIIVDDYVWIEVLFPESRENSEYAMLKSGEGNENDISLVLKVHYYGVSTMLTGDLGFAGEERLFENHRGSESILDSDILKVAHHGSRNNTGDEFLRGVNPSVAVIQVGRNGFGHPTRETLEKLENIGAEIYRNDMHGAIAIFLKNGRENLVIKTIIGE